MKKHQTIILAALVLIGCSQTAIEEKDMEIEQLTSELNSTKEYLRRSRELSQTRGVLIKELEPQEIYLVPTDKNTITQDCVIVDVIDPFRNIDNSHASKSLIVMVFHLGGTGAGPFAPHELILENDFQGEALYDKYASQMKVGAELKFTYSRVRNLSEKRDIGRILDVEISDYVHD